MKNKVITRFAPSPTGALHIGAARTALFNFIFAEQQNGSMILRIEDTDKKRSENRYEKDISESLKWLGISYTASYRQSERALIYKKYTEDLIKNGFAYVAEEGVIRFKNPGKKIVFEDILRGNIKVDTTDLGDFVIARSAEEPLYHLAVVIDDHEMGITHIIRGEDHISNTPRQILIQEAIGAARPLYVHIPLILAPDRSKLSKRHGAVSILEYRKEGYLPEALINFMALLGWSSQHGDGNGQEIFSLKELVKIFSFSGIQKGGAVFNIEKLKWVNKEHVKRLPQELLNKEIEPFLPIQVKEISAQSRKAFLTVLIEKIDVFSDINRLYDEGELSYFWKQPEYAKECLLWKNETDFSVTKEHLDKLIKLLSDLSTQQFTADLIKEKVWPYATEKGRGFVLWPFRYALSGKEKSSDPFVIAEVLGKEETLQRLKYAMQKI